MAAAHDLAFTDPLPGLLNRRGLIARLDQRTDQRELTVFYIDLDGMKETNARYGHDAGDRLVVDAARRLGRCVRPGDVVSRIDGDEFVVIAPGVNETAVAEQLRTQLNEALTGETGHTPEP